MPRVLNTFLHGLRVGHFVQGDGGRIAFEYDDSWRRRAKRIELSVSLPKSRLIHQPPTPGNFLWGLLPDNDGVLQRWGSRFGVSPGNPLALLEHVGLDVAGAIQLTADDHLATRRSSAEPISDREIADRLRQLRDDPDAWLLPGRTDGGFSLAGAQPKFALARVGDTWALPTGDAASTHIFKPGALGFSRHALNEHLCLAAAGLLGLRVTESAMHDFEGEPVIVVTRYDREVVNGHVYRRHQEDLLQAFGMHPEQKYQNDGGPGIRASLELIRSTVRRSRGESEAAAREFFEAIIYNWLIAGTDAHAKNYALLHAERGSSLAPFYDVSSALPYPELDPRRLKLAMSVDGRYRLWEISPAELVKEAESNRLDPGWAQDRIRELATDLPAAFGDAIEATPLVEQRDLDFARGLRERVAERATDALRRLGGSAAR